MADQGPVLRSVTSNSSTPTPNTGAAAAQVIQHNVDIDDDNNSIRNRGYFRNGRNRGNFNRGRSNPRFRTHSQDSRRGYQRGNQRSYY